MIHWNSAAENPPYNYMTKNRQEKLNSMLFLIIWTDVNSTKAGFVWCKLLAVDWSRGTMPIKETSTSQAVGTLFWHSFSQIQKKSGKLPKKKDYTSTELPESTHTIQHDKQQHNQSKIL